jgi:hypothetical protein
MGDRSMSAKTSYEQAYDVFSQFGEGLTFRDFEELMETRSDKRSASARLSQFVAEQLATKVTGAGLSVYVPTGRAFADRVLPKRNRARGRKRPTDGELIELREWKAKAQIDMVTLKRELALAISGQSLRPHMAQIHAVTDANELADLRQWKADAIRRYPDLGAPRYVIAAREKVADYYRGNGDGITAALARAGKLDDEDVVRAMIAHFAEELSEGGVE